MNNNTRRISAYFFKSFGTLKFSPKSRLGGRALRHEVPDQPLVWNFLLMGFGLEARSSPGPALMGAGLALGLCLEADFPIF